MSGLEITVIAFGLFLGYWVVSKFMDGSSGARSPEGSQMPPQGEQQQGSPPGEESSRPESHQRTANEEPGRKEASSETGTPWHTVLGISPDATVDEIRQAYRALMGQYHPDKVATLGAELRDLAERKSKEINAAYEQGLRARGAHA